MLNECCCRWRRKADSIWLVWSNNNYYFFFHAAKWSKHCVQSEELANYFVCSKRWMEFFVFISSQFVASNWISGDSKFIIHQSKRCSVVWIRTFNMFMNLNRRYGRLYYCYLKLRNCILHTNKSVSRMCIKMYLHPFLHFSFHCRT